MTKQIYRIYDKRNKFNIIISDNEKLCHNVDRMNDDINNVKYIIIPILKLSDVPTSIYEMNKQNWDKQFQPTKTLKLPFKDVVLNHVGYIYVITNKNNGKIYIGQTIKKVSKKWSEHVKDAVHGSITKLHLAIRKNNFKDFGYKVIAEYKAETRAELHKILDDAEQFYIRKYRSTHNKIGYNISERGSSYTSYMDHASIKNVYVKSCLSSFTGVVAVPKNTK